MSQQEMHIECEPEYSIPGPDDPPFYWAREEAAYAREQERLVRDHLGKVALVHGDDVVGVFNTAGEAIFEGFRRFGYVRMLFKLIRDPNEPPDFVSMVDINHPSVGRLERRKQACETTLQHLSSIRTAPRSP